MKTLSRYRCGEIREETLYEAALRFGRKALAWREEIDVCEDLENLFRKALALDKKLLEFKVSLEKGECVDESMMLALETAQSNLNLTLLRIREQIGRKNVKEFFAKQPSN